MDLKGRRTQSDLGRISASLQETDDAGGNSILWAIDSDVIAKTDTSKRKISQRKYNYRRFLTLRIAVLNTHLHTYFAKGNGRLLTV